MNADFSKPVVGDAYADWSTRIVANYKATLQGLDPAKIDGGGTPTGAPTNSIRWNSANKYWELYNGSSWGALESLYAINISGNAATVTNGVYSNGTYNNPAWLNTLAWSKLTGTPTTLSGYGISDSMTAVAIAAAYAPLGGAGTSGTWGISISGSSASCSGNAATATTAGACSGNAATATKLATARTINGVGFDGSTNITISTGPFSAGFTSSDLTITANTALGATAHSLGGIPAMVQMFLVCQSTDGTYNAGDVVPIPFFGSNQSTNCGIGLWMDATNLNPIAAAAMPLIPAKSSTTGGNFAPAFAKWKLRMKAWL